MSSPTPGGGTVFLVPDLVPVSGLDPAPGASARFTAWADVFTAAGHHALGDAHDAWTADELRGLERDTTKHRPQVAALADGVVVGAAGLVAPRLDNTQVAWVYLATHPRHRGMGVGSALLRWAEATARDLGRTTLLAETHWLGPADADPEEGWARRRGFTPAQTVLRSDLDLAAGAPAAVPTAGSGLPPRVPRRRDAGRRPRGPGRPRRGGCRPTRPSASSTSRRRSGTPPGSGREDLTTAGDGTPGRLDVRASPRERAARRVHDRPGAPRRPGAGLPAGHARPAGAPRPRARPRPQAGEPPRARRERSRRCGRCGRGTPSRTPTCSRVNAAQGYRESGHLREWQRRLR